MAPPNRKSELHRRSDSIARLTAEESQEAGVYKGNMFAMSREIAKSSYAAKRKPRLNVPFKPREDSFIAILKKNARDLTIEVTSDDELVLSFKTTKQDLGILHATRNQLLLPWRKSSGGPREYKRLAMRAGVHRVEMGGLKSQAERLASPKDYDENYSGSKLKVSSFSIVSESNENFIFSACSVIPNDRQKETKGKVSSFGAAIASTSKAYVSSHSKSEILSECAATELDSVPFSSDEDESISLNSDEDCVVTSSSFSDQKRRMSTIIVRRSTGKLPSPYTGKLKINSHFINFRNYFTTLNTIQT